MHYQVHLIDAQKPSQNYIWLLEHCASKKVVVVDPTDAKPVKDFCQKHGLEIAQIWLTHWHQDHIGGVPELIAEGNLPVYGPREELSRIPFITHPLLNQDHVNFHDLQVDIIAVPGHTLGHIVYFIDALDVLFCGDTLFAMGCGRIFEGTPEQMYHSLNRLAALPAQTQVYCTHEYTLANAQFALEIEPDNLALQQRFQDTQAQRQRGEITLPSSIALELATNPFLRTENVEEFARLRQLKDQY